MPRFLPLLAPLALAACGLPSVQPPSAVISPCPIAEAPLLGEAVLFMSMRRPNCIEQEARLTDWRTDRIAYGMRPQGAAPIFLDQAGWQEEIKRRAAGKRVILYIHGFNNDAEVATRDALALAKSIGPDGAVVTLFWPTLAGPETYYWSMTNRDWTATYASALIRNLTYLTDDVTVIGHSMGGWLALDAVNDLAMTDPERLAHVKGMILASPDVDRSTMIGKLVKVAEASVMPVTIYASGRDKILQTAWLTNGYPRGGDLNGTFPGLLGRGPTILVYPDRIAPTITLVDTTEVTAGLSGHADYVYSEETAADICRTVNGIPHGEARRQILDQENGTPREGNVALVRNALGEGACAQAARDSVEWLQSVD